MTSSETAPAGKAGAQGKTSDGDGAGKGPWTVNTDGTITVPLSRPLDTHGGPVRELKLREPGADLYFKYGPPMDVELTGYDDNDNPIGRKVIRHGVIGKYIAACSGLDELVLEGLAIRDVIVVGNAVGEFLNDAGN